MPPKLDINKSGWESAEFPAICESCLGPNPYVRMTKREYGKECKICTRPFTVFSWHPGKESRYKKTEICLTCSRIKNCCQNCLLDLQFGLPIQVRDAALKLVNQGPQSDINREYYAQNNEGKWKDGNTPCEFGKVDSAARELLKKLARSEPYYKKQIHMAKNPELSNISNHSTDSSAPVFGRSISHITSNQLVPPQDKKITSLFIIGIEDDLPEHAIRVYFEKYGPIKSLVCSHRSRCAFVNFTTRVAAETAAKACRNGDILINGCPLKVQWGRPRPLGGYNQEQQNAKMSRFVMSQSQFATQNPGEESHATSEIKKPEDTVLELPPGQDGDIAYQSMHPYYQT
ncbi:hypothetical protein PNEG_00346 [Pneumocystis murina B123]|uniref:RRM domain-containing protein n=1 Tax=Pneumocystis murina (strain B123) TaxID=1069680 RepID=M7NVK2_PNEMU|nr:hypothetical protein PNEG_00346 [Pneumocystis murina B123]EMR11317.1 hypothetical protein PNEG_00346 [Pneumocystis murina B123]